MVSLETDPAWYERIRDNLAAARIDNVDLRLVHADDAFSGGLEALDAPYVRVVAEFGDAGLDWVLVDGVLRDACALAALEKIRPGGILVVDNVNWVLPSPSRSPGSVPPESAPASELWAEFEARVHGWRRVWTTNGVCDTAVWTRPS